MGFARVSSSVDAELLDHESPEQPHGIIGGSNDPVVVPGYRAALGKHLAHFDDDR